MKLVWYAVFAAALGIGAHMAHAATNYVETPQGFYTYRAPGLGNAMNQNGG